MVPARKSTDSRQFKARTADEQLARASEILRAERDAIDASGDLMGPSFVAAVDVLAKMQGSLILTGMGKAGLIAKKLVATFASTGTRSHFVHPAEAVHGDLGRFGSQDVVLVLSNSGETEEVVKILPVIRSRTACLIAMTGNRHSTLANAADILLPIAPGREACALNLAPTSSTTAMLALGDALALVVSEERGFSEEDFAAFHPGGSLGIKLSIVDELMRPLTQCRVSCEELSVREIFANKVTAQRRSGAVMLVNASGKLTGIFTDSDLARLLERRDDAQLDGPISAVMTRKFTAIQTQAKLIDAVEVLAARKISELPVVDMNDQPLGMIDITDIMQIFSAKSTLQTFDLSSVVRQSQPSTASLDARPTIRIFR